MNYSIRHARKKDIPRIMEIINQAKIEMAKVSDQWQDGYPNEATIAEDINNAVSYVLVDSSDSVIGTAAIIQGPDFNYSYIEGTWKSDKPYYVIHRIAVANESKGKGLAHYFFEFCRGMGASIRIDTHEKNLSMQRAILKEGFHYCGVVYVGENQKRLAYEWIN